MGSQSFTRNVTILKREDVKLGQHGEVLTPNNIVLFKLKKAGQFMTDVEFCRNMTACEVKRKLEESFPMLVNKRFSCAKRKAQNSAGLEFLGKHRVWDGRTISRELRGGSALYIVMEDEESFSGTAFSSPVQDHYLQNENSQQVSHRLPQSATTTSNANINSPDHDLQNENSQQVSRRLPQSATITSNANIISPDHDLQNENNKQVSHRLPQSVTITSNANITSPASDMNIANNILRDEDNSGPDIDPVLISRYLDDFEGWTPFDDFQDIPDDPADMDSSSFNEQSQIAQKDLSTDVSKDPPNLTREIQGQKKVQSTSTSGRSDSGLSSEESSPQHLTRNQLKIGTRVDVTIKPSSGPLQGGDSFFLEFDEILPESVKSAWATFGNKEEKVWKTYEGCILHGRSIPPGEVPGPVQVTITTQHGNYLGQTQFTYVDQRKKLVEEIVSNKRKLADFFSEVAKQFKSDVTEENSTHTCQRLAVPNQGNTTEAGDILKLLVYTAAQTGAEGFIRFIFSSSARQIVFDAYRNESPLPEHIAEANGHETIAVYIRDITERFAEEDGKSETLSKDIDWLQLAKAVEESEEQFEPFDGKDVTQLWEDDTSERAYFGDAETSSDSEKERSDSEDSFKSHLGIAEEEDPMPNGNVVDFLEKGSYGKTAVKPCDLLKLKGTAPLEKIEECSSQDDKPKDISRTVYTDSEKERSCSGDQFEMYTKEHSAGQNQGNAGPRPPKRPDYGTVGRSIKLRANLFRLNISPQLSYLYHYNVKITPKKCPKTVKRDVVNKIIRKYQDTTFQGHQPAFDGKKNLYSRIKLPPAELSVELPGKDGGKDREFKVKIQFVAPVSLLELKKFLSGEDNEKMPQDAVQALDIVMQQMPSFYYTSVGQSFLPFDGQRGPLGEGCEVQFGFYSNVRHSEWKAMLVNIDVSAKCSYKSQDVIDFLCQTLGVTPQNLEDRRFQLDNRKLEKAIHGIRIRTTHAAKRKYTVWGVSGLSAERQQFDFEEKASGRKIKTTVAEYFDDRYKFHLRYPHLPCLQVGQKKDCYLPMEVCTIIPCRKRHLTEQLKANMIRSAARPAPERQQNIQYAAQQMIKASSKYLKEEFKTSVSSEMVKVDGRVLPAPKIKLGPQDQALVPRNGSWDMRNKSLHEGARVQAWALACFAPSSCCNEDHLRNFCKQMASVSNQEGMRMTEEPAVVRYARGCSEVERLFSKFAEDYPELRLIMAVLPNKTKDLYSEIKRVGDNVLGIPTQCVQSKVVQQAKPQLCANISLKINSKLGGINHVIDPTEKSPVFREPVIIFGADVTHPSPTENGIPSIAAVVASMDANAIKYYTRVRAQRHEKQGGAQEIINDLATMVKELLIEFYKANRQLKPSKIIFYRDGVSEGQFDQVLVYEVRAVQEACMMLEKEYRPRITFVVIQKRHHTRLFCEDKRDESGRGQNVPPGTTVDSGITHPYEFDFYLCSHSGIQEKSRPTHYHVLYDDNAFTGSSLQQLTYQLCHVYAPCTRSVSVPAPAYYAHSAASRAREQVTNGGNGRGAKTVDLEKSAKVIQVNDRIKGAMYFI